jgi:hypothetical protein
MYTGGESVKTFRGMVYFLASFFIILSMGDAKAQYKVEDFNKWKDDTSFRMYILGVGNGYTWANIDLEKKKENPLFCPPKKLALTVDNLIHTIDMMIKDTKYGKLISKTDTPIELILLKGLQETFPCK